MQLSYLHGVPSITFNGKKRFLGKTRFIKMLKNSGKDLKMGQYCFTGDTFNIREALNLIFS
jgi:hypothetical protein